MIISTKDFRLRGAEQLITELRKQNISKSVKIAELEAALEVLERKLNSTVIHESSKGYWVDYAIRQARKNLKRKKPNGVGDRL